jgi:hypothetical protein
MTNKYQWLVTVLVLASVVFSFSIAAALMTPVTTKPKVDEAEPELELKVSIIYEENYIKPPKPPKPDRDLQCYDFIGRGVKWKDLPQNYVIDPDFSGMTTDDVVAEINKGINEWDTHTSTELFGDYTIVHDATLDTQQTDGRNELLFGDFPTEGVIAVCYTWGYFSGPPKSREIIEFDIMFDTDFEWGIGDPNKMDLWNIAVHEIGHGLGLADVYEDGCTAATMYGYSDYGDTSKRDLDTADETGLQELYGA